MGIPTIFILFLIFIFIFQHNLRKSERSINNSRRTFWEREEKSLFARKTAISPDDYIQANPESLPQFPLEYFHEIGDEQLYKLQQRCLKLANEPMMNLSDMMNSDVRIKYGAANLGLIENYENNYNQYLRTLYKLAKGYYELNKISEAVQVLEEGIHMQTDISDHILLLGTLYQKLGEKNKFDILYNKTLEMKTLTKAKTIQGLDKIKEAF